MVGSDNEKPGQRPATPKPAATGGRPMAGTGHQRGSDVRRCFWPIGKRTIARSVKAPAAQQTGSHYRHLFSCHDPSGMVPDDRSSAWNGQVVGALRTKKHQEKSHSTRLVGANGRGPYPWTEANVTFRKSKSSTPSWAICRRKTITCGSNIWPPVMTANAGFKNGANTFLARQITFPLPASIGG